jgi:hypothetical protein
VFVYRLTTPVSYMHIFRLEASSHGFDLSTPKWPPRARGTAIEFSFLVDVACIR